MMKRKTNTWSVKEQAVFLKRLSELLKNGYTMSQAFEFLQLQLREPLRDSLEQAIPLLKEGKSLYRLFDVLSFNQSIIGYLYFAEQHGDVVTALSEGGQMLQRKLEYSEKLRKLLRYPLFMLMFVGMMLVVIEKQLLPQFQSMYSSMNADTTIFTTILFNLSLFNKIALAVFFILTILFCFYYFFYYKELPASTQMDLLLKLPIVKTYCILLNSHYFSNQLSNLLKGGISIYQSLHLFTQQGHSRFFNEEAEEITRLLKTGERLDAIIASRHYYQRELSLIIYHGQSNGEIAQELFHYSQYVLQKIEEKVMKSLVIVQPVLFGVIGVIIMLMYLAMLLPMFNLINAI